MSAEDREQKLARVNFAAFREHPPQPVFPQTTADPPNTLMQSLSTRPIKETVAAYANDKRKFQQEFLRALDEWDLRDQFVKEYLRIEAADKETLEKCSAKIASGAEVQPSFEDCILEMFDNWAAVLLESVFSIEDKFKYSDFLHSWCDEVLPLWELDYRSQFDPAFIRKVESTIGSLDGRISGTVSRAKLTARFAHWEAEAANRVRQLHRIERPESGIQLAAFAACDAAQASQSGDERRLGMEPNWNLIRLVMLAAKDSKNPGLRPMDGYSQAEVGYQAHLLIEAGLAEGSSVRNSTHSGPSAYIGSLTMPGHQFADLARDDEQWEMALTEAERTSEVVTLDRLIYFLKKSRNRRTAIAQPERFLSARLTPDDPDLTTRTFMRWAGVTDSRGNTTYLQTPRPIEFLSEEELSSHPEDPVGPNPCPADHPAHKVWEDATREALLELFRFQQKMLGTSPRTVGEYQNWFVESCVMRFQIWAKRNLSIVQNDLDARAYDRWLQNYLEASMDGAFKACRPDVPREETLSVLRVQLLRAHKYWSGNALENVTTFKKRQEEEAVSPGDQSLGLLGREVATGPPLDDAGEVFNVGLPPGDPGSGRKGDASLLGDKRLVNFLIAEEFLGIGDRQRQNLIAKGLLKVEGEGSNRKITTESLRKYLPPEDPK